MTDDRPESIFQRHLIDYLKAQHGYTLLDAEDISDKEFYIAEAFLLAFIKATQAETLARLQVNYGSDSGEEILKALKAALAVRPLWLIIRNGLTVRDDYHFQLFYPKPRSSESIANQHWLQNRIQLKPELVIKEGKRPDVVLFLNGLPIVVIELKHDKNQTVHDAVKQFNDRNHDDHIFRLPFLYVAMDTADIKVATDPRLETNFRWHNAGLSNEPQTESEYPVEFFYRDVLAKDNLLTALSFYLVYVPEKDGKPSYTVFPRFHQSRLVDKLSADIQHYFADAGQVGKKYLVNHSAGSGKTLTISWLAERLHSLYKADTAIKLLDIVFILTDRKSLDKNVRDDLDCFLHLDTQMAYANKSSQLKALIYQHKPIIVTTIQKFQRIFDLLHTDPSFKTLRVAFLIDEAHRSQEGKNARAIRQPFQAGSEALIEQATDSLDAIKKILLVQAPNQLFVAFTATPTDATVKLFGKDFDTYSEAEAIAEGYIVDVAAQIVSYETLYNLHLPFVPNAEEEKLYPKGIISKLLKQVAFEDDGLIQYKAEVMLRAFEEQVKPLIDGKAKAMIVASSRVAGLKYYRLLKAKIAEKQQAYPGQYNYKVLYAFSDFTHRETNKEIREHELNGLNANELIEERFKQDDYRIMVVASKFQTGFNEPLLAGMFLDKPVMDKNAVQTVSRLNRRCEGKSKVIVIDFTNNTANILKAFNKYRKGTPYEATPPDQQKVITIYQGIIGRGLFTDADAGHFVELLKQGQDAVIQTAVNRYRQRFLFQYDNLTERKAYVYELAKLVKAFNFLSSFYQYEEVIEQFVLFAEFIQPQLLKEGAISELMKAIRKVKLVKANVVYKGVTENKPGTIKESRGGGGGNSTPRSVAKTSIQATIDDIRGKYPISDEEALIIREVCEEKQQDETILLTIQRNKDKTHFLNEVYKPQIRHSIEQAYSQRGHIDEIYDDKYVGDGAIFDMMAHSVLTYGLGQILY